MRIVIIRVPTTIFSSNKSTVSKVASLHTTIRGKTQIAPTITCQAKASNKLWLNSSRWCKDRITISWSMTKKVLKTSKAVHLSTQSFWTKKMRMAFTLNQTTRQMNWQHLPSQLSNNSKESPTRCCLWIIVETDPSNNISSSSNSSTLSNRCKSTSRWCSWLLKLSNNWISQTTLKTKTTMATHLCKSSATSSPSPTQQLAICKSWHSFGTISR